MISQLLLSPLLTAEQCRGRVSETDFLTAEGFCDSRAAEYLTWRAVLANYLGSVTQIVYTEQGAPRLEGSDLYIGVSHTVDLVAVVVSDEACAVDVERKDRDVKRISERFLSASEREMCSTNEDFITFWCARECYYKLRGDSSLSLLTDMRVTAYDTQRGFVTVEDNRAQSATFRIERTAEHIVVYTI